jgi:nucleoside-diphosphate-sugar epimerase
MTANNERAAKTFLVTGGAGFLGINLVRYLLARGQRVVSLDVAEFSYPERSQITEIQGDIRDRATVERAMAGVDLVIHTAAALPLYKPEEIYSTDIDGLRTVLQSAFEQGVERVVHVSSTAVYGIPDHHPLLENDRLDGVGPYGEAKVGCLRFSMIGPRMARISPCWAAAGIVTNCLMWKISATPFTSVARCPKPR